MNNNSGWIKISERLPVIPEGKYGVNVIIATWDGEYQEVYDCSFMKVTTRDGKYVDQMFEYLPIDGEDFGQMYLSGTGDTGWVPIFEEITHWQYFPEAPGLEN